MKSAPQPLTNPGTPISVLALVGLLFVAAIYPVLTALWHPGPPDDTGDTMMVNAKMEPTNTIGACFEGEVFIHLLCLCIQNGPMYHLA
jgi:hypothetical protein